MLERYRLVERIGAGGMGEVWKAHDARLDRTVAIKRLLRGAVADDTHHERFRREALTLSRLSHPGIATIFDFESAGDHDLLVMEFVPGGTLESRLREGPLPLAEVRSIGASIADALEDAHRQGVLHRDLKPGNVALTSDGRPKILDFGLALLVSGEAMTGRLTQAGTVMGSLAYMAPEQLAGEEEDARTDVYALGATLFELATGQRPFSQERPQALMFAIINTPAPSLRSFRPDATADLDDLIASCLQKDRARRPASAAAVAEALRQLPAIQSSGARPPRRGAPSARSRCSRSQRLADPAQEYFADGMTEAVISDLARIKALRVISRTSAMRYKGTTKSLPEIARELNVDAVLEGSALLVGKRVRINVQLIAARTDETLWAERYDRRARGRARPAERARRRRSRGEIAMQLTPSEATQLARRQAVNPEAHLEYLKSRHSLDDRIAEGVDLGIAAHAKRALEHRPGLCAGAWAALADCHIIARHSRDGAAGGGGGRGHRGGAAGARTGSDHSPTRTSRWASSRSHTGRAARRHPVAATGDRTESRARPCAQHARPRALLLRAARRGASRRRRSRSALDPLSVLAHSHGARRRVLLRARSTRRPVLSLSHGDRARTALRRRPHRSRALARGARPLRRGAGGVRGGAHDSPAASPARRSGSPTWRPPPETSTRRGAFSPSSRRRDRAVSSRRGASAPCTRVLATWTRRSAGSRSRCEEKASGLILLRVHPRLDPIRSDPRYWPLVQRVGLDDSPTS